MSDNDYDMSSDEEEDPNLYYQINYFDDNEFNKNQDEEKEEQDMDKIKEHDIENLTSKLIKNAHKSGLSRENAFIKICGKISTLETPSKENTIRWFNGWKEENLNPKYLTLIEKIIDYYSSNLTPVIFKSPFDKFSTFFPGSSRYEINIELQGSVELCVFDNFHGKTKHFKFVGMPWYQKIDGVKKFHPIDQKHVLVFDSQTVTLLQLDYATELCWISSQKDCCVFGTIYILSDIENPSNFVHFSQKPNLFPNYERQTVSCFVQFCQILNDELVIKVGERMTFVNRKFFCPTLDDKNILTVFEPFVGDDGKWELSCCVFDENTFERQFLFNGTQNVNLEGLNPSTPFAWFEEECFVLMGNKKYQNCLYSLNISTQTCTMIYINFPTFSSLHFDFDGNLAAKKDYKIYLYTIKKPQKLDQIVWNEIHRQLMMNGNKNLYNGVMKELPTNSKFQPFSV